jgi:hypothetical protein
MMGRRQGSKNNSKHHEAGGKQKGAGTRPKTKKDAPAQQRLQQATLRNAFREPTDAAEDPLLWLDENEYDPPIVAPLQQARILTLPSLEGTVQQRKKCVYFPYCKFEARFCGGTKRDSCREVNKGEIPTWDRILEEKRKRLSNDRSERKRQKKPAETTNSELDIIYSTGLHVLFANLYQRSHQDLRWKG